METLLSFIFKEIEKEKPCVMLVVEDKLNVKIIELGSNCGIYVPMECSNTVDWKDTTVKTM